MANSAQPHQAHEPSEFVDEIVNGSVPLANPRHEMFAQFRALTGCKVAEAYRQAGGKATGKNAAKQGDKIAARQTVKDRIAFLQSQQADRMSDRNIMGRREILLELKTNVALGREVKGGLAASNRALEMIGSEEHDMFVQKRENRNRKIDELDGMDPDQLIAFISKAVERIPGLEIDAEALANAVGVTARPEIGRGGITGDRTPDSGSEVSEG